MNEVHIPSIGGNSNVIAISQEQASNTLKYEAFLTQVGTGDPSVTVINNSLGITSGWGRFIGGIYALADTGKFPLNLTVCTIEQKLTTPVSIAYTGRVDDNVLKICTYDIVGGAVADDLLTDTGFKVTVQQYDVSTHLGMFNGIISLLDDIQKSIWTKIVLRLGNIVWEVDGNLYRKTASYNLSAKQIRS